MDLAEYHAQFDVKLGGACSACHQDMERNAPQGCTRCHGAPYEADAPSRIGLKGAYHRQCIGCHERQLKPASAPTACNACHHPWTPDHGVLVSLPARADRAGRHARVPLVPREDRPGHPEHRALDLEGVLADAERLRAPDRHQPDADGEQHLHRHRLEHAGVRVVPHRVRLGGREVRLHQPGNIDCLVCHDTTGTYRKDPGRGGLPDPSLDLAAIARKVGRPSRQACGSCHFASGGGGPYTKHGDLEPALANPPADLDVHMGALKMRCQDCHQTTEHRISGMSMSAPAVEGRVGCEKCHGQTPHGVAGPLSRHLDNHIKAVACETLPHPVDCPRVADVAPARLLGRRLRSCRHARSLRHAAVRQAVRHAHLGQGPRAHLPLVRRHA